MGGGFIQNLHHWQQGGASSSGWSTPPMIKKAFLGAGFRTSLQFAVVIPERQMSFDLRSHKTARNQTFRNNRRTAKDLRRNRVLSHLIHRSTRQPVKIAIRLSAPCNSFRLSAIARKCFLTSNNVKPLSVPLDVRHCHLNHPQGFSPFSATEVVLACGKIALDEAEELPAPKCSGSTMRIFFTSRSASPASRRGYGEPVWGEFRFIRRTETTTFFLNVPRDGIQMSLLYSSIMSVELQRYL
jgi:hypothetical protein